MYLNTNPTDSDLKFIENWLYEEYKTYGEGLYSNWHLALESNQEGQLAVFKMDNKAVGFVTWQDSTIQRNVNLMAIQPKLRRKGFGRTFFQEFENVTRNEGFVAILLFCSPEESQFFWRKVGFFDVHKATLIYHGLSLYKPLTERVESTDNLPLNRLELWDMEPIRVTSDTPPKWIWDLSELTPDKPIIEACHYEWNLRVTIEGKLIREDKVKYFREQKIHIGSFLYLTENVIWKEF